MEGYYDKYRNSIRLKGWDYTRPGNYFVTICTKHRLHHLGDIRNGIMGLSEPGIIAHAYWLEIPDHYSHVVLDEFVVMPNHIHGILKLEQMDDLEEKTDAVENARINAFIERTVELWKDGHDVGC